MMNIWMKSYIYMNCGNEVMSVTLLYVNIVNSVGFIDLYKCIWSEVMYCVFVPSHFMLQKLCASHSAPLTPIIGMHRSHYVCLLPSSFHGRCWAKSSFVRMLDINKLHARTVNMDIFIDFFFRVMVFYCVMITQNLKETLLGNVCCQAR